MKDRVLLTDPDAGNFGLRKTSNTKKNHLIDHLNHLIHYLNHLIDHPHHLNQIGPEDLSQCWQNNIHPFSKHHRKLETYLDSRAEVLQSSSVLFTSIQVRMVLTQVSDVIDSKIEASPMDVKCHVNQNPVFPVPGPRFLVSRSCCFFHQNHWKELHLVQFSSTL